MNLTAEHGYSMVAVMLVMLVTSILAGAAFSAVGGDIPFARAAQDRKQSYAAAEAGIEYYLYQLARDNDYWASCADVPGPAEGQPSPVNPAGVDESLRTWRNVTGTDARYSIELLPANDEAQCDSARPAETMLDASSGTFRVRSTGVSRGIRRSVVTAFRRTSFLDYLYFTDFETLDPAAYSGQSNRIWAQENCAAHRAQRAAGCSEITFPDWDAINGPLHTNDDLLTCGSPDFGRGPEDKIEIGGPAENGWSSNCAGEPSFVGTKRHPAAHLAVPTSNERLRQVADDSYVFYGQTTIRFDGTSTMQVTTHPNGDDTAVTETLSLPPNGVIFVEHNNTAQGTCGTIRTPLEQRYDDSKRCAILTVSGTYPKSMTLASRSDILIDGDLERSGDVVLGLIADNFVRVKHQVSNCNNVSSGTLHDVHIEAAILTLAHSFIVDNYSCGNPLGELKVDGAIAQRFRGPVGRFSGTTLLHGYVKNYNYDDRLRYRNPPFFLDPVSASWRVIRSNEQVPAA
ncbi:MAG: hypothetical protein ACRDPC_06160 [Solirubrobacteraceae bacterium]